jgi:hypothetical protein
MRVLKAITVSLLMASSSVWSQQNICGSPPPNRYYSASQNYDPWDIIPMTYCIWVWSTQNGSPVQIPVQGVQVSQSATVGAATGYHWHMGAGRPVPTLLSTVPANSVTDSNGCVKWRYQAPGYAGWYTMVGNATYVAAFQPQGDNTCLIHTQHDWMGNQLLFDDFYEVLQLIGSLTYAQPETNHLDSRHGGTSSRYGTAESTYNMSKVVQSFFANRSVNTSGVVLDILRGSLPWGGVADNAITTANGASYLYPEWTEPRQAETHMYGVEWDVTNPASQAGGNTAYYTLLESTAARLGCTVGKNSQTGGTIQPYGASGYWSGQSVVHLVCSVAPENVQ